MQTRCNPTGLGHEAKILDRPPTPASHGETKTSIREQCQSCCTVRFVEENNGIRRQTRFDE